MTKSIDIVLIHTRHNNSSIATLCSIIERSFPDLDVNLLREDQLEKISSFNSSDLTILGFSFTSAEIKKIQRMLKYIRRKHANLPIQMIAGGSHASGDPYGTLKMGFDLIVNGEAEETLPELIRAYKDETPLEQVKGISLFKETGFIQTEARAMVDINEYSSISRKLKLYNHLEITRGCPFQCKYCQTSRIFGIKPRHKSIETIMKDVKFMKSNEKTDFRFISPNALGYGSVDGKSINLGAIDTLLKSIRDEIQNKGRIFFGTFPSEVRPEFVREDTLDILKKYVNNDNLVIGAQSGSPHILKEIGRGHSLQAVYDAVNLCKKYDFQPILDFIFGFPMETKEDQVKSIEVFQDLHRNGARIHMHFFIPLPGTPYWDLENPVYFLDKDIERMLNTLASKGVLFGHWKSQEKISRKIIKYRKKMKKFENKITR
ncbi:MAG: TIGR04013 family B12-binding domain/radical SAM domain-containing protein [Candidatus Helarchaeota archaeon]